jgi:hypothetical protein
MPTQGLKPAPSIFRVSSAASETLVRSNAIANVNPAAPVITRRREAIDDDSISCDAMDQLPGPPFEQPSGPLEMEILISVLGAFLTAIRIFGLDGGLLRQATLTTTSPRPILYQ